jgi:hypothetical protein
MNRLLIVLSFFAVVVTQRLCAQSQDELLMRRWKITKISTEKILKYNESLIENPGLIGEQKPQVIIDEENLIQNLIDKGSFIHIKKGKVFIIGMYNFIADEIIPIKTIWDYLDKEAKQFNIAPQKTTKTIKSKKGNSLKATNSVDYTRYRILELTTTKLKLLIEVVGDTKPNTIMELEPFN